MFKNRASRFTAVALFVVLSVAASAEKTTTVDSGSFEILVHGQQIATERFEIRQSPGISTATSELKLTDHKSNVVQRTELQLTAAGNLRRYEWRQTPGKEEIIIEPDNDFLIEHIVPDPPERPVTHPFLLPVSTMVLDDYAFHQREILAWRYLAQACSGKLEQCRPGRIQFGVLIPQEHSSAVVSIEYKGLEKTTVRGVERELNCLDMKVDGVDWLLYLDTNLKVVQMLVPSQQIEAVRN